MQTLSQVQPSPLMVVKVLLLRMTPISIRSCLNCVTMTELALITASFVHPALSCSKNFNIVAAVALADVLVEVLFSGTQTFWNAGLST